MDYRPLALGALALFVFQICSAQPPKLKLVTFEAPPYQEVGASGHGQKNISGETVETVTCAAEQAGWSVHISLAPEKRAVHSLKTNSADGYFAAAPSAELDAIASRSYPVALEKWYFFTPSSLPKPGKHRIGAVDGSNEEAWLKSNGYNVYLSVTSPGQLLALLKRKRIDAALMDERVMEWLSSKSRPFIEGLHPHFLRYAPLHFYLAKAFQKKHPEFLPAFNRALPACMGKTMTLTSRETKHIEVLTERLLTELTELLDIQQALKASLQPGTLAEILTVDSKWRALAPEAILPLASHILALPASKTLEAWQRSYQGLVTEVMVINNMGAIAAMSQLTSDFWQGDEPKFLEVAGSELAATSHIRKTLFISPIRYDQSTARFQVTVSVPIFSGDGETPNGMMALGLDIEKAMGI